MKISNTECAKSKASSNESKILADVDVKSVVHSKRNAGRKASLLEQGMETAKAAMETVPDVRIDIVDDLKKKIENGEYNVSGTEIAEMMIRRLKADKTR